MKINAVNTTNSHHRTNFKGNYERVVIAHCSHTVKNTLDLIKKPMDYLARISPADFTITETTANQFIQKIVCSVKEEGSKTFSTLFEKSNWDVSKEPSTLSEELLKTILSKLENHFPKLYRDILKSHNAAAGSHSNIFYDLISIKNSANMQ